MKALLVGDLHLSDRAPSSCTESYCDDILSLLAETVELAASRSVDVTVWAGDTFHHKQPGRTSHRLVQRAIDVVASYPCPLYIVPGNHDMQNDRFDSLYETQPLGVLFHAGARLLDGWMEDAPIFGVPWLQEFNDTSVTHALAAYLDRVLSYFGGVSETLVVAHAPLYPPGTELPFEFYPAANWAYAMAGDSSVMEEGAVYGSCFYGHVHDRHGIYEVGGVRFANFGAITRGSLHESELTRTVAVSIWDSETGEFEEIPLKTQKHSSQVFRIVEKAVAKEAQAQLDTFLASIGETSIEITSIEAVLAHVQSLGLDEELCSLITELLQGVS